MSFFCRAGLEPRCFAFVSVCVVELPPVPAGPGRIIDPPTFTAPSVGVEPLPCSCRTGLELRSFGAGVCVEEPTPIPTVPGWMKGAPPFWITPFGSLEPSCRAGLGLRSLERRGLSEPEPIPAGPGGAIEPPPFTGLPENAAWPDASCRTGAGPCRFERDLPTCWCNESLRWNCTPPSAPQRRPRWDH